MCVCVCECVCVCVCVCVLWLRRTGFLTLSWNKFECIFKKKFI